jgi:hypothetical protein
MGWGGGWRVRARPFIQVTNVYVSPRYRDVVVNVHVNHRGIDYRNVDRWRGPHRDAWFAPQYGGRWDRDRDGRRDGGRDGWRDGWRDDDRGRGRGDGRMDGRGDGRGDGQGSLPPARRGEPVVAAVPREAPGYATPDGYRRGTPRMAPVDDPRRREPPGDRRRTEGPGAPRLETPPPPMSVAPPELRQPPRREPPAGVDRREGPRESRGDERRTARPRDAGERPPG